MAEYHEYPKYLPAQGVIVQNAEEEKRVVGGAELQVVRSAQGDIVSVPPAPPPEPVPEPVPEPPAPKAKRSHKKR